MSAHFFELYEVYIGPLIGLWWTNVVRREDLQRFGSGWRWPFWHYQAAIGGPRGRPSPLTINRNCAYMLDAVPRKWVHRLESGCTAYILGAVPRKWVQGLDVLRTEVWGRSIRAASHVIF